MMIQTVNDAKIQKQFDDAVGKYETVLWTHTADMYASKVEGV